MTNTPLKPVLRDYGFVVTKPLQLIFATSIIRQLGIAERSTLVITDDFKDALAVCKRLQLLKWDLSPVDIRYCADRSKAEQFASGLGAKILFVDSDVGLKRFLLLMKTQIRSQRPEIWVYEEGHGSYRTDMYQNDTKRRFLESLGIGTHFGGSRFTNGIYLRDPDLYVDRFPFPGIKVRRIEHGPSETIGRDLETWANIFAFSPVKPDQEKACAIYLTDWSVHQEGMSRLNAFSGDKLMKPHPHMKTPPALPGIEILSATAPAELVIMDLLDKYPRVSVFHHGSSCERYVVDERLTYVRL